ncbi:hypothetical protein GF338_08770 [candidate division WOR-3 bacterium]|nr:hypothetical protein [candidate division WOR-3 bacterium]
MLKKFILIGSIVVGSVFIATAAFADDGWLYGEIQVEEAEYEAELLPGFQAKRDCCQWFIGTGPPDDGSGQDGDLYYDTSTGDIYENQNGTWVNVGNITGSPGEDGSGWIIEDGDPWTNPDADSTDYYMDSETGIIYIWDGEEWIIMDTLPGGPPPDNSVGSEEIIDGSITNADLDDNCVDSDNIIDGSITNADLDDDCVDSDNIIDGSILGDDLADCTVDPLNLAPSDFSGDVSTGEVLTTVDGQGCNGSNYVVEWRPRPWLLDASNNLSLHTDVTGNVGIGTQTPAEKLHVVGNVKIEDGNQGENNILTSDADGVGTWKDLSVDSDDIVDESVNTNDIAPSITPGDVLTSVTDGPNIIVEWQAPVPVPDDDWTVDQDGNLSSGITGTDV